MSPYPQTVARNNSFISVFRTRTSLVIFVIFQIALLLRFDRGLHPKLFEFFMRLYLINLADVIYRVNLECVFEALSNK
jgi:hypothetical protein